eukprot:g409.t1
MHSLPFLESPEPQKAHSCWEEHHVARHQAMRNGALNQPEDDTHVRKSLPRKLPSLKYTELQGMDGVFGEGEDQVELEGVLLDALAPLA